MQLLIDMPTEHTPVLAGELVDLFAPEEGDVYVDCTFGGGGHARLLADALGPGGELVAIDRDPSTEPDFTRFSEEAICEARFIRADFAEGLQRLADEDIRAQGIYMDLGMSSLQLDARERGFSYSYEALLDMRMDRGQELSAYEVVNDWPERRLESILREYGEERYARRIARSIVRRRSSDPIRTTTALVDVIKGAIPAPARFGSGHPARRTFQAIRIAVNDELDLLELALPRAWDLLDPGGVLAAISFHSLEDRLVKRFMVDRSRGCNCPPELPVCVCGRKPDAELITRKPVVPSPAEIAENSRARPARLRAARKIKGGGH